MNSNQLEYFLTVCRTNNISTASEELFLTRQALSKSIQALEDEVGVELFVRRNTGLYLTEAGTILREFALQNKLMWDRTLAKILDQKKEHFLRLGCHLTHLPDEVIEFFIGFQDSFPNVTISLHDNEDYTTLFKSLRSNELDIAYARRHPEEEDLSWVFVRDFNVSMLVNKDNPLASQKEIDWLTDLRGLTCYVLSKDTIVELTPFATDAGLILEYMTPSIAALRVALNHNRGIFFAPSFSASVFISDFIVARKVKYPLTTSGYFVFRTNPPPLIKQYLEYLKDFAYLSIHQHD